MARNESSDSEFDQDMERVLREHFEAEALNLSSPSDPWPWLESRMEEPVPPSFFHRILGSLNPVKEGRLSPAFAVAGVAVVAVVAAAVVWSASGSGGAETLSGPEGLASAQPTTAPAGAATRAPMTVSRSAAATTAPAPPGSSGPSGSVGARGPAGPAGSEGTARSAPTPAPAAAAAPAAIPTPAPAPALGTAVPTVEPALVAKATPAPAPTEAPRAMAVPTATPQPAPVPTAAPQPAAAPTTAPAPTTVMAAVEMAEGDEAMRMAPLVTKVPEMAAMRGPRCGTPTGPRCPATPTPAGAATSGGSPPDVTFRDNRRQPFVETSENNVSTFSLDTDRTSFHLALNWARAGYEINPDSVRAEEWVNAFDYGYPPPSGRGEFAVSTGLFPHPLDDGKLLARIGFQAPELVEERQLNVTLVLDASGSMADGNRVSIARQAAESIRQSLREEDRIAVVHFTSDVIDRYTVEHSTPDDERVVRSIRRLQPHDSTNVQAGLNLGVRLADDARELRPDAYNYVILMSDGVANVDATDPFAILETAYDSQARNPLRLITIGVGINNYNDPLLELLAQHGNGWYRYVDSVEQAQATFTRENWLALSTPFADQTRAQVTWDSDVVERWRIIGYENRVTAAENFTQDLKEFAEIYSGAATTVFYELELVDGLPPTPVSPFDSIELRWVDPATGDPRSWPRPGPVGMAAWQPGSVGTYGHPLAHFGAIVALAADLYGGLPGYAEENFAEVHSGLTNLRSQLDSLRGELGSLDSYNDFSFLLEHITSGLEERLPPSTPSGYSR